MKPLLAAAALAALVMSPWALSAAASAQPATTTKQAAGKKKALPAPKVRRASPYSANPEYDVYVHGEYAGSDPDPRIRHSIAREYRSGVYFD